MSAGASIQFDAAAVAAQFPILQREIDGRRIVYLDSGATAQKPDAVLEALDASYRLHNANIHRGVYTLAQEATERFEGARERIARFVGGGPAQTIFTKNVTEAINLVAYSWGRANVGAGDTIVLTPMEHHANIVPWQQLARAVGARLEYVTMSDDGRLDLDSLDALLALEPKLVAVAHVSNVLGTLNPVAEIVRRAHAAGAVVLVDGAQAVPHLPLDLAALDADFYGFTGHKVYGPTGVGVLHGRRELLEAMEPFLTGGDMIGQVDFHSSTWKELPWKFEAGTSPYLEATGLGAAVEWLDGLGLEAVHAHEAEITRYALERLAEVPGLTIYGPPAEERGAIVSFALDGVHPHDVAEILGREQICVRAGHHCAQPLMRRLGVPATTRASFAAHTTTADVDALVAGLETVRRVFQL
ncbi:SufS family cysteine desulfurase [Conexibacter sp. JD483]|uniref:SufS family cysteine desulfurase n=1 Tax=unclassified Conexibacter TaxID=2627773 RepID=UPI00271743C8|nr:MULTISPECIES: SufS family cysteine desulfurase [unclassified Conexibacter]MDO8184144.1 SufS family cysteine desulfurase [Conexibacter sp. CPCC 205706]MDO8197136.1 SufS family cysteine desulfurase [Conexibacter sp. CPCC 205762]MDR9367549.1 SufS family cysteine desulfurase [Conexibacter sp. JD483]